MAKNPQLRGTVVHDRHFATADGTIAVHSTRGGVLGPEVRIDATQLRALARMLVSVLRYVEGSWVLDEFREKLLRHQMDTLAPIHGLPPLNQVMPLHMSVPLYSDRPDPGAIDLLAIRDDVARHYPSYDCVFDLCVLTVTGISVVDAFLFPWELVRSAGPNWTATLDLAAYRVPIPDDAEDERTMGKG